jgi:hypothetical protein
MSRPAVADGVKAAKETTKRIKVVPNAKQRMENSMSTTYVVRQGQQQPPEWISLRQATPARGYDMQGIPLADVHTSYRQHIRVRAVSNEAFLRSLTRNMFQQPTTFQAEWDGQQTTVVATPTERFNAVHIQAGDVFGIISLGEEEQEPTTSAMIGEVLAAIVLITAGALVTIGAIVLIKLSDDEGSGEAEAETGDRTEAGTGTGDAAGGNQ